MHQTMMHVLIRLQQVRKPVLVTDSQEQSCRCHFLDSKGESPSQGNSLHKAPLQDSGKLERSVRPEGITEGGRGPSSLPWLQWELETSGLKSMAQGMQSHNYHLIANTKESCPKHTEAGCSIRSASASAALYEESLLKD